MKKRSIVASFLAVLVLASFTKSKNKIKNFQSFQQPQLETKSLDSLDLAETLLAQGADLQPVASHVTVSGASTLYPHKGTKRGAFLITKWSSLCQSGLTSVSQYATTQNLQAAANDIKTWHQEVSAQKFNLNWDIWGPYYVNYPQQCGSLNRVEIASRAVMGAELALPNFNVCDYDYLMIYPTGGTYGPGGKMLPTGARHKLKFGSCYKDFSITWLPWKNDDKKIDPNTVVRHEFGHSMTLNHAGSWDCGNKVADGSGAGCTASEYGHRLDTMGLNQGHYNCSYKEHLGWAKTTTATYGSYTIYGLEANTDQAKCLKIDVGGAVGKLYVAYRSRGGYTSYPTNFDNYLPFLGGLVAERVRFTSEAGHIATSPTAWWLDCAPNSRTGFSVGEDWKDAALAPGRICDTGLGYKISFTTKTATSVQVTISP